MKDKDFKKHRKRVEKIAKKWLHVLGLKWWSLKINYIDEWLSKDNDEKLGIAMTCTALWQYVSAEIDVHVPVVAIMDDNAIERAFVHECMHILVSEMRADEDVENHEERVCQMLTKAFMWTEELL